ncbi:class II aldolase/adducin family protein [Azospirillum sp. TSO35-2]|uniref:class II aldolase/adducin family protein n=1 Tax=Azospirillum sp. TSO35-2 TaxID=716796 RepID=UPI000D6116E5|nr:class II aldolase/adducin family protein [Azospirillum sp. TSO35-2]PWC32836.1 aldolase [Azospirillum sp. TSO35-2]
MEDSNTLRAAVEELVVANHILFDRGIVDGFGHVSVRHPDRPDRFLLSRNRAPGLVSAQDILVYGLDAEPVDRKDEPGYLERFIHSEIYRAHPEVMGVVHSHAVSMLPFTVVAGAPLCPICHMSGFLKRGTPIFEIRDHAGDASDLLIRSAALGCQLAAALEDHAVVLMRGHGMTVVGRTLRQSVFRSIYAEVNARIQATAASLGTATFLTEGEAAQADATNTGAINRAWDLWALAAEQNTARLRGA